MQERTVLQQRRCIGVTNEALLTNDGANTVKTPKPQYLQEDEEKKNEKKKKEEKKKKKKPNKPPLQTCAK
eukprot:m.78959 g.78959  ORF g.78959 m.78959 type:complete len:70 (+) comp14606_c0_seq3:1555-1764(+)